MPAETLNVKSLHFAWFAGHVATLVGGALHLLSSLLLHPSNKPYYLAYLGAVISYAIVVYQSHGMPTPSGSYLRQLVVDENTCYLAMAVFWLVFAPTTISISVIPYGAYSLFHVASFARSNLLTTHKELQQKLKSWTDIHYGHAMRFVAFVETVPITARIALSAVWSFHWTALLVQLFFLRYRYLTSAYTRQVFRDVDCKLDAVLPPAAKPTYKAFGGALARCVDTTQP